MGLDRAVQNKVFPTLTIILFFLTTIISTKYRTKYLLYSESLREFDAEGYSHLEVAICRMRTANRNNAVIIFLSQFDKSMYVCMYGHHI